MRTIQYLNMLAAHYGLGLLVDLWESSVSYAVVSEPYYFGTIGEKVCRVQSL
jgi:hypothetical protein